MTNIQPGWYQDPSGSGQTRWWDGTQWTDHVSTAAPSATPAAGGPAQLVPAETGTPFIWVFAILPILSILTIVLIDPARYFALALRPDPSNPMAMFTPGYFGTLLLGLVAWVLYVIVAALDRRALESRGVPRPFHWGWTFLSAWVYIIGRTVVVRRRTGVGSFAPLIVFIVVNVVVIVVTSAVFISAAVGAISTLDFS